MTGRSIPRIAGAGVLAFLVVLTGLWTAAAFWYQLPAAGVARIAAIAVWACAVLCAAALIVVGRRAFVALAAYIVVFAGILVWWTGIAPQRDRDWAPDVARTVTGSLSGHTVTLDNVRDFDWTTADTFEARWEDRTYDLSKLASADLILSTWGVDAIAHTLISFGFENGDHVVFSVEIRREEDEEFSEIGGFFKEFELAFIAADESDILRLRTNIRGESVSLYPLAVTPAERRALFLSYVSVGNDLARHPEFYNTVTANCTTVVFDLARMVEPDIPFDWRILLSGYLPGYLADHDVLAWDKPYGDIRERAAISAKALAAGDNADYSKAIRADVPAE